MEKKKKLDQWAVLRKGAYTPILTTYSRKDAEEFIKGHENIMFVAEVIQ